jgi:hypothetical protein
MSETTSEHIPPHRAWAIQRAGAAIKEAEQDHLLVCGYCIDLVRACAVMESFGALLKKLDPTVGT